MAAVAAGVAWFIHTRRKRTPDADLVEEEDDSSNPLEFKVALIFAGLFVIFTVLTHYTLIYAVGWGTLANMFLVGYSFDFFTWLNDKWIPAGAFDPMAVRILVMIPALFIFIIAASAYMGASLGTSPYDAISYILADKIKKVPFRVVRICYDLVVCVAGWALGSTLGVVTVIMSLALGPVITWMTDNVIDKYIISDKK